MDNDINKIINKIKKINKNSCDINYKILNINNKKIAYVFLESVASDDKISNFLGKSLSVDVRKNKFKNIFEGLQNTIPNSNLKIINNYDDILYYLFNGFTCIFIDGENRAIAIETKAYLDRGVGEATNEPVLKGPKDSFTENYQTNIGLIRKRIKDNNLIFEEIKIGKRTKTKVAISYISDIVNSEKLIKIKNKLKNIDIDGIINSTYLSEFLDNTTSLLPKVISTERPDYTCMSLLNGKIVLLVENSPYALIYPGVFADFFTSPDDFYGKPINSSITRLLRYLSFFIAVFLPAFYLSATTYDMEIIPNQLLISFAIQKQGVPFPTIIEVFILIVSYEILREADTRKPQIIGASISIVGALILGESAVSAGIISPIVVIIVSVSAVAGMTFNDPDMINAIRFWRIIFMLSTCFFGLIGIVIATMIFITRLCIYKSLDTSYLSPFAPFSLNDFKESVLRFNLKKMKYRPLYLKNKDNKRLGEK